MDSVKFLLVAINAKYIHSNLGIYSLKAYAQACLEKQENLPVEIELGEYTINQPGQRILADIFERKPDIVGFSCYIWNISEIKQLLGDLPKILPKVRIWLGGPEASYCAEKLLSQFPQVEGVMQGEGEASFGGLVQYYGRGGHGSSLSEIPGLVYRNGEGRIVTSGQALLLDLSRIPFVYTQPWMKDVDFVHRIIYYESSRGCPFSCSYCLSSIDKQVRFRELSLVFAELAFFLNNRVQQVKFVDRTFNCKRSHSAAIWQYLLEHDNGVTNFHFEISADLLDEKDLDILKKMRPGLIQLEIGVQSTNLQTIKEIRRTMDLKRLEKMAAKVREGKNIHQHLDLIAGLPFEDLESFRCSFDRVYRMKPNQLQLGFLKVLNGSWMEEQKAEYGLQFTEAPPYEVLRTKWLNYSDIQHLKAVEEMVEVYYNSGQFSQTICRLEAKFARPVELFEALAAWEKKKNPNKCSSSRQARYTVLFAFVQQHFPEEEENFRDSLTIDVYLREKAKTRPVFARDLGPYREVLQKFYRREEKERKYLYDYFGYDSRQLARMTHIEVLADGRMILFDYLNRDPLSYNARMVELCE